MTPKHVTRCRIGNVQYALEKTGDLVEFRRTSTPHVMIFIPEALIIRYVANLKRNQSALGGDREVLGLNP